MAEKVLQTFTAHRRRYGSRRIRAELISQGTQVGRRKVCKPLAENGLKAIQPKPFVPKTTQSKHPYAISPNRLADYMSPAAFEHTMMEQVR